MTLRYASTFTAALGKLSSAEQKQVKLTAFDLQVDPKGNGLQMHRIEKSPGFWSVRVSGDIRIILHKDGESTLLAYVDHHDAAYQWAERKRVVAHERTGAMQFVEVPVVEASPTVLAPQAVQAPVPVAIAPVPPPAAPSRKPFAALTDDQMLDVGVPRDWLHIVRGTAEADLFELLERLPAEASEALLDHATGGRIEDHVAVRTPGADPYAHPDALRRFRVVDNLEELQAALDQPFETWAVFLHPAQRSLVERDWSGPARISGSAGTGKTIVALHRAAHLARFPGAKVLLTTFSKPLAAALARRRDILARAEPDLGEKITVSTLDQAAFALFTRSFGQPTLASASQVRAAVKAAQAAGHGGGLTSEFLFEEWDELVDAWAVVDGESYAKLPRLGRRTRLGSLQRQAAWEVFAFVRDWLAGRKLTTWPQLYDQLTAQVAAGKLAAGFSYVVVDEAQDLSVAQARFLGAFSARAPDAVFFTGDLGQRIFHLPFSWKRLGLDIRGRGQTLKVNYRTSHQIRATADRLLPDALTDVDGVEEGRGGTVSVFDGPDPQILLADTIEAETTQVAAFLKACVAEGMAPADLAVLVRSQAQISRARAAVNRAGLEHEAPHGVNLAVMHDAKGLEFRGVAVMACDDDILPDAARIEAIGDMAELEAVYESERRLLYVACTRPRDRLLVSAVKPGSEFLGDFAPRRGR